MKNIILLIIFLTSSSVVLSQNEPPLESLLLKIDLPKSTSELIKPSELEKAEFNIFRFYFSSTAKENTELHGKSAKYQPLYSSFMYSLCEALRTCENQTFKFPEDIKRNDFLKLERRYSENSKTDYDVILYFDSELELKLVEKVIRTFDNTKKIGNIYLGYTNKDESNAILLYKFNPKDNYIFINSNNEKYSDWVNNDFKVQYGEVITVPED